MTFRAQLVGARTAWLLLAANTLLLFALPVLLARHIAPDDLVRHDRWSWDWQVWLAPALGVLVPHLWHRRARARLGSAYRMARDPQGGTCYRAAAPVRAVLIEERAIRCVVAYVRRLAAAACFCAFSFLILIETRFIPNYGCVRYDHVRTLSEHLTFAAMLLGAILFHVPTTRRVLGDAPCATPKTGARLDPGS